VETPEIHQPHARHTGGLPRWLELVIAITALVTSVSSIAIAIHHGHVMEMLVQANSFPYMQAGFSDVTPEGKDVLSLDLLNRGVGPAHEESLRVRVGPAYVRTVSELFAASLGAEHYAKAQPVLRPMRNQVRTRFIPGGQSQSVFSLPRTAENTQFWELLAKDNAERWDVELCYCSVFQECWDIHSKLQEPVRVKWCRRDETREFLP
jgi:hypothetical protein